MTSYDLASLWYGYPHAKSLYTSPDLAADPSSSDYGWFAFGPTGLVIDFTHSYLVEIDVDDFVDAFFSVRSAKALDDTLYTDSDRVDLNDTSTITSGTMSVTFGAGHTYAPDWAGAQADGENTFFIEATVGMTVHALRITDLGPANPPTDTDTSNGVNGLDLVGDGLAVVTPPVAAPPATLKFGNRVEKALPYPVPTMVNGRPT
jgi:hypothetical protein